MEADSEIFYIGATLPAYLRAALTLLVDVVPRPGECVCVCYRERGREEGRERVGVEEREGGREGGMEIEREGQPCATHVCLYGRAFTVMVYPCTTSRFGGVLSWFVPAFSKRCVS